MATLEELTTKLDQAKKLEVSTKADWNAAVGNSNKETKYKIYSEAKDARKKIQRDIEALEFAADKIEPKPAPAAAPAPKKDNDMADLLWAQWLRKQGRRPSPRPAGWGE